ncbi:MAG: filamentous hemagglutinin N-terminal domain-containing protein, partial [Candidatus Accumulibacter sp.]|nr:filamentous hemagglutinin N-terminal domain-containing protein [Accumulibacter sp.]
MNHSYRLAWNESSQSYVAAPECARGKGKAGKGRLKPLALVLGTCLGSWLGNPAFAAPPAANALPTGGQVVAGQASVAQSGSAMTVTQGSDKAILNWQTFDIGSQASVRFIQPSTNAVALNRVLSGEASQIYGKLGANGHVFLVNPAGVVFGAGSKIDVGGLVASTMDITNEDFLAGRLDFRRNGATGGISNHGEITAGDGGLVALLASTVKNEGVLSARLGTVALAAGDRVTLPAGANGHLQLAVEPSTVRTLVENRQMILADGGQVLMTSRAADALSAGVVANSGTIRAQTLQEHEGRILLLADMAHGEVRHGGLLDASAPNGGDGGFVETSAATVSLEGQRKVTTLAPLGKTGTWLIDPNDYTIAASGGNITGAQLSSDLALSNVTIATASQGTSGGNGDIFVNAPVTWSANTTLSLQAQRYIEINADITATGNTAGLVLGTQYDYRLGHGARITLSGAAPTLKIGNPGSEYNYTVINTLAALQAMNNNRSGRYALGSDIDATATETWNGGAGFQPIGTKGAAFSGVFAGLGHTIGKLTINAPGQSTVGLFGMIQSALLRDFGLKAATIRGGSDYYVFDEGTGPIVGWAKSSNIRNVYAIDTGTSSTASGVGGLVGLLDGSTLDNSYATGTVKALVGAGYAGLGGLVGHLSSGASIMDSYTKAQVSDESGTAYAGSLAGVGSAGTGAMSSIIRSYAFNYCSPCSGNPTSGIIGYSESPLTVFSSYYNDGWGSSQAYGTSIGNSTRASSYAGLDFVKTWRIYEDQSTPVLRAFQRDAFVTVDSAGKT